MSRMLNSLKICWKGIWPPLKCCWSWRDHVQAPAAGWSEAANVGEALQLLWEVIFVEHRVCAVFYHLQGHRAKHRRKLVDALRSGKEKKNWRSLKGLAPRFIFTYHFLVTNIQQSVNQSASANYKDVRRIKQLCETFPPCVSDPETAHQWQCTQGTWTFSWGSPTKKQNQHDTPHTVKPPTEPVP